jgi:hypothetical protein
MVFSGSPSKDIRNPNGTKARAWCCSSLGCLGLSLGIQHHVTWSVLCAMLKATDESREEINAKR